jgi:hypothetical protein
VGQDILYSQTVLAFENQFKEFPSCSTLVIETNIKIAIYEKNGLTAPWGPGRLSV